MRVLRYLFSATSNVDCMEPNFYWDYIVLLEKNMDTNDYMIIRIMENQRIPTIFLPSSRQEGRV